MMSQKPKKPHNDLLKFNLGSKVKSPIITLFEFVLEVLRNKKVLRELKRCGGNVVDNYFVWQLQTKHVVGQFYAINPYTKSFVLLKNAIQNPTDGQVSEDSEEASLVLLDIVNTIEELILTRNTTQEGDANIEPEEKYTDPPSLSLFELVGIIFEEKILAAVLESSGKLSFKGNFLVWVYDHDHSFHYAVNPISKKVYFLRSKDSVPDEGELVVDEEEIFYLYEDILTRVSNHKRVPLANLDLKPSSLSSHFSVC